MTSDALAIRSRLLGALCAEPREPFHRAVFADWVEENHPPEVAADLRARMAARGGAAPVLRWVAGLGRFMERRGRRLVEPERPALTWRPELVGPLLHDGAAVVERGGFLDEVRCDLACWLSVGRELVSLAPLACVRPGDRWPRRTRLEGLPAWRWGCRDGPLHAGSRRDALPRAAYRLLDRPGVLHAHYATPEAALADLSRACLLLARAAAGLPVDGW